jgi:hypothetical protein
MFWHAQQGFKGAAATDSLNSLDGFVASSSYIYLMNHLCQKLYPMFLCLLEGFAGP